MKSIKPGRGPSMMGAVGGLFAVLFGVVWTMLAMSMGAPTLFALFGVFFVCFALVQAVYNYKNATSKNRYSSFDITDHSEEPDPLNSRFSGDCADNCDHRTGGSQANAYCPWCGRKLDQDFQYCPTCGRELPKH